jgi:hypothetical protein
MRRIFPLPLSLLLFVLAAASGCGRNRSEVRTVVPPTAPSPLPVPEYKPNPAPEVVLTTATVIGPIAVASQTAVNVIPHEPPQAVPSDANFVLIVSEAVGDPAQDLGSYTKVFVDNQLAGQTETGPKSADKKWGARLAPGNHLFRFEKWNLPKVGDWAALDAQWQPPERFIRVEAATRAVARLKFFDDGRGRDLQISREPLGAP